MPDATAAAAPPADRDELVTWVDELLDTASFPDYCPNGMQVVGAREVATVATAVSASAEVFERAAAIDADLLVVHHGLFWKGDSQRIGELERRRLRLLFDHDITLA